MRPHVTVNLAMSADGKISTTERRQVKISGKKDFERVDDLKARSDAIMVGIGTVLADNPSLTVKSPERRDQRLNAGMDEHPVRIVVDSLARTPAGADILQKGNGKRIIAVTEKAPSSRIDVLSPLAEIIVAGTESVDLAMLLGRLYDAGIRSLMVEGGGTLIWSLFRDGLVDEFVTFVGNVIIGGGNSPTPADGSGFIEEKLFPRLRLESCEEMEEGVLIRWKIVK